MSRYIFIFLILALMLSCSEEKNGAECKSHEKIVDGKCVAIECLDGEQLVDGECIPLTASCGGKTCEEGQSCVESKCADKIVVSTFNLYDLKLPNAYENLATFIKEYQIDVMLVQEIQTEDKSKLLEALEAIGIERYIEFSETGGYGGEEGDDYLAVISRFPLDEVNTILRGSYQDPISLIPYYSPRPILEVKLQAFGKNIILFNLHFKAETPWGSCTDCINRRRAQAASLEEYILYSYDPTVDYIVTAGDANTATPNGEKDFQEGQTLDMLTLKSDNPDDVDNDFVAINYTYKKVGTHTKYDSLMDHILLSPSLLPYYVDGSISVLTPEGKPSDHKAVLLELILNK